MFKLRERTIHISTSINKSIKKEGIIIMKGNFTKQEKKWIKKNLIETVLCIPLMFLYLNVLADVILKFKS